MKNRVIDTVVKNPVRKGEREKGFLKCCSSAALDYRNKIKVREIIYWKADYNGVDDRTRDLKRVLKFIKKRISCWIVAGSSEQLGGKLQRLVLLQM